MYIYIHGLHWTPLTSSATTWHYLASVFRVINASRPDGQWGGRISTIVTN